MVVAAIQVEPIGIRAFVVNQTPWVQAWKNPKFQAPRDLGVSFHPSQEGLGGGRFVAVDSCGKIDRGSIRRGFFGIKVEEGMAVGFGENLDRQPDRWSNRSPAF